MSPLPEKLQFILDNIPLILSGIGTTLSLVSTALLLGLFIAIPCGIILARSKNPLLRWPVATYSYIFRGTPMLIQAYMLYYGISPIIGDINGIQDSILWSILRETWPWLLISLVLNTGAYTCEIVRGAIETTPNGEIEAAKALGMSPRLMMRRIIFPSALRRALSSYGNEIIFMLQGSSIVSVFTMMDITGVARKLYASTYDPYTHFGTAGLIYLAIVISIVLIFRKLENRISRHLKPRSA